ncbi:MAG TPA: TetR/AcrR family transcriptional regulator, partial [Solirubrobacterales bacterium]|nr:TetR/AcrR family transcriptional regulator [Solirubrobacterales bacterium]
MDSGDIELPTRRPRGSRRRPDLPPPQVERLPSGRRLSRAEVIRNQRRRILDGLAAALAYHGYEDTKITDIVELAGISRPTFYGHFESKESCFAAAYADGVERLALAVGAGEAFPEETARLLAGGLASHLSGRVLAG